MNALVSFFQNFCLWILNSFVGIWEWLCLTLTQGVEAILAPIASSCPDLSAYWGNLSVITPYVGLLNRWIAVDVGLDLLMSYFAFILVMIPIKLIVKLFIPTVG